MRVSAAWDPLGPGNGPASLAEMRAQIGRYSPAGPGGAPEIGCILLRDPRFFAEGAAVSPPPGFASSIMQGKGHDLAEASAAAYFGELLQLLLGGPADVALAKPWRRPGPVFGDRRLAPYRLGQEAFEAVVADAYRRQCAITGTHIPPVLQAAHVRPVTRGG